MFSPFFINFVVEKLSSKIQVLWNTAKHEAKKFRGVKEVVYDRLAGRILFLICYEFSVGLPRKPFGFGVVRLGTVNDGTC